MRAAPKSLLLLIDRVLAELHEWREKGAEASCFDDAYPDSYRRELERAKQCRSLREMGPIVATIAHMIVDSGPTSEDFMPSFDEILDDFRRLRKKKTM